MGVDGTKKRKLYWCHLCRHWRLRRLSYQQPPVALVTTELASRQLSVSVGVFILPLMWGSGALILHWRHNGRDSVSNHQPHDCLLNIQTQIKENIKAPRHWPLCGEFTGDRWTPRTNGQLRGKCFHLMTSSWDEICGCPISCEPRWLHHRCFDHFGILHLNLMNVYAYILHG